MSLDGRDKSFEDIGLENFAPYLMNRIMGRYNASLRAEMARQGLTTPKVRTLAVLAMIDGLLIGHLAVYAVVEFSTLSRTLDSLEEDDLVRRQQDAEDARATRIHITEEGRTAFREIWPSMAQFYNEMFQGISEKDKKQFVATLQAILLNVRRHDF